MTTEGGATIVVQGVSRWFGDVVSVSDVSFEVGPGVTGLLGPNGAGKTTLLRMIAGLARPSEGTVRVLGEPVRNNAAIFGRIGVMPEHEGSYGFQTGRQFVEFNARLQGVSPLAAAVDRAIDLVGMQEAEARRIGGYSRGMRQRIRLAATLVHDPPVLLLDEPLSGTDPRQRLEFQETVRQLGHAGKTIVFSSHILEEVEDVGDRILLMVAGKLAAAGNFHAIRRRLNKRPFVVRVEASDSRALAAGLVGVPAIESLSFDEDDRLRVRSRDVEALQHAIPRAAQERDVRLLRVEPLDDSLESVFTYLAQR